MSEENIRKEQSAAERPKRPDLNLNFDPEGGDASPDAVLSEDVRRRSREERKLAEHERLEKEEPTLLTDGCENPTGKAARYFSVDTVQVEISRERASSHEAGRASAQARDASVR